MFAVTIAHFNPEGSEYFQELDEDGEIYSMDIENDELRTHIKKEREEINTENTEEGVQSPEDYTVYNAEIENRKDFGDARVQDEEIDYVILSNSFNMYINLEEDAIVGFTKKDDTEGLLDYLMARIEDTNLRAGICKIDVLELILEEATEAKGGFFDEIDIETIDSSALFGDNVDQTADFERFTEDGDVTDQTIYVPYNGKEVKLKAHRSGILLFFEDYSPAFVLNFIDDVILPHVTIQLPSS